MCGFLTSYIYFQAVANNCKSSKVQNKPSSPGVGYAKKSLSCRSVGSSQACFKMECLKNSQEVSAETSYHSTISPNSNGHSSELAGSNSHPTPAAIDKVLARKEEYEEVKHTSLRNHRVLESNQMNKGQKIEGKQKVGAERRTKAVVRRDIKGVDLRDSSRTHSLAVGVAS